MRYIQHNHVLWLLRIALAFVFVWFGVDKFFHPALWEAYMPEWILSNLPFSLNAFMTLQGIGETVIGILLLTPWFRFGALLAGLLLLAIVPIVGLTDIGIRDIALLLVAIALMRYPKE
ncbi:MAG: hypothetical protein Q7S89_03490 [bacterium]|nr:hypothetical protein [bacterium]